MLPFAFKSASGRRSASGLGHFVFSGLLLASAIGAELPSPSNPAVTAAIASPLISFNRNFSGGAHTNGAWNGGASITLALASHAGNTATDARLLQQIRHTLSAGNEPTSNGGYPSQHEKHVTGMFVIAKHTPRIWNQLTNSEKTKIDLIMKGTFVASAFTTGDNNPFIKAGTQQYSIDGDANIHRDWNPNYREGMIGGVLVGVAYFGGPVPANAILTGYNHNQFLADLSANNLPNIRETFNWKAANSSSGAPTATQIQNAVANYSYYGYGLTDYMRIYQALNNDTYQKTVNAGLNNGAGINGAGKIVAGAGTLPNPGAPGMLKEFDTSDGGGARSSLIYCYDGFRPHMTNQLALIVSGLWPKGSAIANAAVARQNIGNTDLWYKAEQGYIGYAKGVTQPLPGGATIGNYSTIGSTYGFVYNRSTWEDVLKVYHGLSSDGSLPPAHLPGARIQLSSMVSLRVSASATAAVAGVLAAASLGTVMEGPVEAGGIKWWKIFSDSGLTGWLAESDFAEAPADEFISSAAGIWQNRAITDQTGTFSFAFNVWASASGIDAVIGLSNTAADAYSDLAVILRMSSAGVFDARNGGIYQAVNSLSYQPGVVYRVHLIVNTAAKRFSATVTPPGGAAVEIARDYAFRTEQASVGTLDNLATVATGGSYVVSAITQGGAPGGELKISSITKSGNIVTVAFEGVPGGSYDLNKSTTLDFSTADIRDSVTLSGTSGTLEDTAATGEKAFYRVERRP